MSDPFTRHTAERIIRGKHKPSLAHWRISKQGFGLGRPPWWEVLEPFAFRDTGGAGRHEFDTYEQARAHVVEQVTAWLHANPDAEDLFKLVRGQ